MVEHRLAGMWGDKIYDFSAIFEFECAWYGGGKDMNFLTHRNAGTSISHKISVNLKIPGEERRFITVESARDTRLSEAIRLPIQ